MSLDDLELQVTAAPSNAPILLFMGGAAGSVQLGDGVRCVEAGAAALCRLPVKITSGGGQAAWSQLVSTSQGAGPACAITAGTSWYFQGWYRDVNGPCGSGFNLTSARSILFTP